MTAHENWLPADWPAPDGVVAGTTMRYGGVSSGRFQSLNLGAHVDDDADAVSENRMRFRSICDLPSEPRWLRQVHGSHVVVDPAAGEAPEADAAITRNAGVVCIVQTADCLPVIFASADGAELAVAHAGWRGLLSGVLEATVRAMSTDPADLLAWLGPAIAQPAFEVGAEVRQEFLARDSAADVCFAENERGRWQADLYGLARMRLGGAGVEQVSGGKYCTFSEPERFFSYRRDGACGRMASFVFRST
jgi:YfiH family protein